MLLSYLIETPVFPTVFHRYPLGGVADEQMLVFGSECHGPGSSLPTHVLTVVILGVIGAVRGWGYTPSPLTTTLPLYRVASQIVVLPYSTSHISR